MSGSRSSTPQPSPCKVLTWGSCILTTGMWSFLLCFGVAMLDSAMASSSSSTGGRNSVPLSVVCDPKLRSRDRPTLLWLKELFRSFRDSEKREIITGCFHDKRCKILTVIYESTVSESRTLRVCLWESDSESRTLRVHWANLRLGCDTMSSTSSGLLCKTAAASLKVTPSRLVLFREMRRPPGSKNELNKYMSVDNDLLHLI